MGRKARIRERPYYCGGERVGQESDVTIRTVSDRGPMVRVWCRVTQDWLDFEAWCMASEAEAGRRADLAFIRRQLFWLGAQVYKRLLKLPQHDY